MLRSAFPSLPGTKAARAQGWFFFPWAQYDTNQSPVRGDSPVPSVCTAHQAEPEEAEAEVPQVSPQPPSHSLFAFSSVPPTLAVLRGHVSHANGRNIVTGQRSLESSLPFICLPYRTFWKTPGISPSVAIEFKSTDVYWKLDPYGVGGVHIVGAS